ncbi:hypothetical protein WMY93_032422 [Mugilogobius chulae]|uniref:Uncharacterized protein n=1 Tax=Mugilogobius chulae TaxID=88201 RepID=A0AAW0MNC6_9GOBI
MGLNSVLRWLRTRQLYLPSERGSVSDRRSSSTQLGTARMDCEHSQSAGIVQNHWTWINNALSHTARTEEGSVLSVPQIHVFYRDSCARGEDTARAVCTWTGALAGRILPRAVCAVTRAHEGRIAYGPSVPGLQCTRWRKPYKTPPTAAVEPGPESGFGTSSLRRMSRLHVKGFLDFSLTARTFEAWMVTQMTCLGVPHRAALLSFLNSATATATAMGTVEIHLIHSCQQKATCQEIQKIDPGHTQKAQSNIPMTPLQNSNKYQKVAHHLLGQSNANVHCQCRQ